MNGGRGQSDTPSQTINPKSVYCSEKKIPPTATVHKLQNKQIFL